MRLKGGLYPLPIKILLFPDRFFEWLMVNRRIEQSKFDIVHIHYGYLGWLGIIGHYPYYLHYHGYDARIDLSHRIRRVWSLPSLKQAVKVFYSTPDLAESLKTFRSDAIFLPNPIRTDLFTPRTDCSTGKCLKILLFSNLDDVVKGTDIAMRALSLFHDRYPEIKISAIAMGSDMPKYKNIPWIEFLEPMQYSMIPGLIREFDVILGQFTIGSLGMSELEGMACAKPVVCAFDYPDWYPEPPPVLSAHQPEQITEHLYFLVEDDALRLDIGQRSRVWVQKYHDYMKVTQKLLEEYSFVE
jgi:glycosyltransferase involved in cell wall biosynthesis